MTPLDGRNATRVSPRESARRRNSTGRGRAAQFALTPPVDGIAGAIDLVWRIWLDRDASCLPWR